jgi:nitrilase
MRKSIRVAVIQASPIHFNRDATLEKTIALIRKASMSKVDLIVFPESFIPAYPRGLTFGASVGNRNEKGRDLWELYFNNSVEVPEKETRMVEEVCRETGAYISLGITEKENKSLYCTQLFFSPKSGLVGKHRKIKPTASERVIWAEGDANTLTTFRTDFGTIGTLICWENYMPAARMAMYSKGVDILITPTADNRDTWQTAIKHIAFEGRCFLISCNQFARYEEYPEKVRSSEDHTLLNGTISEGRSCIISPDGSYLKSPVSGEEQIIIADLEMNQISRLSLDLDVAGHYNRPDIFKVETNGLPDTIDC